MLAERPELLHLQVGISSLTDFAFLNEVTTGLRRLTLEPTLSKRLSLEAVGRFVRLEALQVIGHSKGVEAIGALTQLDLLSLRAVSSPTADFLATLRSLTALSVSGGTIKSFEPAAGLTTLKSLALANIRGGLDPAFISSLTSLQSLTLQSIPQMTALPNLSGSTQLKRLVLENMTGLTDLTALGSAPGLKQFTHRNPTYTDFHLHQAALDNPAIQTLHVGFQNRTTREEFAALVVAKGKSLAAP